jgi:hypothetical protein
LIGKFAIDDSTFVDGVRRGEFRFHPKGRLGISLGCITLEYRSEPKFVEKPTGVNRVLVGRTQMMELYNNDPDEVGSKIASAYSNKRSTDCITYVNEIRPSAPASEEGSCSAAESRKGSGISGVVDEASHFALLLQAGAKRDASPTYPLPEPASRTNLQGLVSDAG